MKPFAKGVFFGVSIAAVALVVAQQFLERKEVARTHDLEYPLILQSSVDTGTSYFLPQGTKLYFDQSFPEGFTRFKIYVNVDGVQLPTMEATDPTAITPLTAYPINVAELRLLLNKQPVTKEILRAVLKSKQISREEIKELLREFSE